MTTKESDPAEFKSGGETAASGPSSPPSVDRSEIRRAIAMSDAEREAYYLGSNQNMLRMFDDARRSE